MVAIFLEVFFQLLSLIKLILHSENPAKNFGRFRLRLVTPKRILLGLISIKTEIARQKS